MMKILEIAVNRSLDNGDLVDWQKAEKIISQMRHWPGIDNEDGWRTVLLEIMKRITATASPPEEEA